MRYLKLYENFTKKYYHGTLKEFPIGFILTPQKGYTWLDSEKKLEDLFEKYKPSNKISRRESVYLVDDPEVTEPAGGYEDYVYLVEPIGEVESSDLGWYTEADGLLQSNANETDIESAINKYWEGVLYKDPTQSLMEYRCRRAKIIELVVELPNYLGI